MERATSAEWAVMVKAAVERVVRGTSAAAARVVLVTAAWAEWEVRKTMCARGR